jgi:serine/threonine-protein kinase RsbW
MRLILQLVLPADARLLPRTRRAIAEYLSEIGASQEHVDDVILALDEACANVIRHAFPDADDGSEASFRVLAEITDEDISMSIEDDGVGFAPEAIKALDLRDDPEAQSGRGLDIIRQVMTSVEVRSPTETGAGTRLHMRKRLREPV